METIYSGALAIGVHQFQLVAPAGARWFRVTATRAGMPDAALIAFRAVRANGSLVGAWNTRGGPCLNPKTGNPSPDPSGQVVAPGGLPLSADVAVTLEMTITGAAITTTLSFDYGA